ncbi:MAG: DUF3090 family protein [Actinomycetota bacterium]|nr:DUF3090 family protein [Actinomycetota bacterium]
MSEILELDPVERITVGTIGPVGHRTFVLQARKDGRVLTLKLEKAQVSALSQYLAKMLAELERPGHLPEEMDLEDPQEPEWSVGTLGVSYLEELDRFLLLVEEAVASGEDGSVARLGASREQVAALAVRGTSLVEAGRPACPLCGYPLDPQGHACPRTNGHRPPTV